MSAPLSLKRLTVGSAPPRGVIMSEFIYLYRSTNEASRAAMGSPEQMQKSMQTWMTWMQQLADKGHIKNPGHPLERSGKLVKGKQRTITDGPYAESKDIIGGYTLVEARDLARRWSCRRVAPSSKAAAWSKSVPCCRRACDRAARASVPAGSGAAGRHADAHPRRRAPGAGGRRRAGRLLPRPRGVAVSGRAGQSLGVAHGHREAPCARRAAARAHRPDARTGAGPGARVRRAAVHGGIAQGRSAAHDVFVLSSAPG